MVASLAGLPELRSLDLSSNGITVEQLDAAPWEAQHLTKLGLGQNGLKTLPAYVTAMTSLAELDLSGNALTALPSGRYLGAFRALMGGESRLAHPRQKSQHQKSQRASRSWQRGKARSCKTAGVITCRRLDTSELGGVPGQEVAKEARWCAHVASVPPYSAAKPDRMGLGTTDVAIMPLSLALHSYITMAVCKVDRARGDPSSA